MDNSKKNRTFALDDEPTALATYGGCIPILMGEDARRFEERARENERKARERAKRPPTLKELKQELSFLRIYVNLEERQIEEKKNRIKLIEQKIKELETNLNGEEQ